MAILFLQNKNYIRFKELGVVYSFDNIVDSAEILNLTCLSTAECVGDTIFNNEQLREVREEILQMQESVSFEHLGRLLTAVEAALEDDAYYLVISGD